MKGTRIPYSITELMNMREEGLSNSEIAEKCGVCYSAIVRRIGSQPADCRKNAAHKRVPKVVEMPTPTPVKVETTPTKTESKLELRRYPEAIAARNRMAEKWNAAIAEKEERDAKRIPTPVKTEPPKPIKVEPVAPIKVETAPAPIHEAEMLVVERTYSVVGNYGSYVVNSGNKTINFKKGGMELTMSVKDAALFRRELETILAKMDSMSSEKW